MQFNGTHRICQRCSAIIHKIGFKTCYVRFASNWTSKEVRKAFLDFFCNKYDHKFVPSSSIIPKKGDGTYFTNAGMNQFKPIFLGTVPAGSELASYWRVANSQKCIRVGGKHNDLDDVGKDLTHHTFFEMLGSWSFGDYFKKEACTMALELLRDVYRLPLHRLYFTYFGGDQNLGLSADEECRNIWLELGIPSAHVIPMGIKENFWDMGDLGPCGPCTEIHYCWWGSDGDHLDGAVSKDVSMAIERGHPDVIEIWNLVFMQFERQADKTLTRLPQQHVDTGMGLERMCALLQGTMSNYNTDLFKPLFHWIQKTTGAQEYTEKGLYSTASGIGKQTDISADVAYRIIADHSRMFTVCIADGLLPARTGVEQKLRTLMYRSFKQYYSVCCDEDRKNAARLAGIVPLIADSLGEAYPEISRNVEKIQEVVLQAEEKYRDILYIGRSQFQQIPNLEDLKSLSGEEIKRLHEGHYGHSIPLDLIEDLAEAHELDFELDAYFEITKEIIDEHHQDAHFMSQALAEKFHATGVHKTDDSFKYSYERIDSNEYELTREANEDLLSNKVVAIIVGNQLVDQVKEGTEASIILEKTPFYAESGGQSGDKGFIYLADAIFEVHDIQIHHGYILHCGTVLKKHDGKTEDCKIVMGDGAETCLDWDHRLGCMRNHTATHLLNAALRKVFDDVRQRGSSVGCDKLSFDFSCMKSIKNDHIRQIEELVRNTINRGLTVDRNTLPFHEVSKDKNVVYLENEVYPSDVNVISMVDSSGSENICKSTELCGGTHVRNTADIESFCVCNASGVAQGIKRIACLTGPQAKQAIEAGERVKLLYERLANHVKSTTEPEKWAEWQTEINAALTEENLPKLVRDELREKIAQLGTDIATKQNKLQVELLQKDITMDMSNTNLDYVIKQVSMKNLKGVTVMLEKLQLSKAVIVIVEYAKGTAVLISLPEGSKDVQTLILDHLQIEFGKFQISDNKGVTVIKYKVKDAKSVTSACERILDNLTKERIRTS